MTVNQGLAGRVRCSKMLCKVVPRRSFRLHLPPRPYFPFQLSRIPKLQVRCTNIIAYRSLRHSDDKSGFVGNIGRTVRTSVSCFVFSRVSSSLHPRVQSLLAQAVSPAVRDPSSDCSTKHSHPLNTITKFARLAKSILRMVLGT